MRLGLAWSLLLALALTASPLAARPARCTVRQGDTLSTIAKRYDVTIRDLRRWNHLRKDRIQPGDRLHLQPATRLYTVKKGDTLAKIARREGATSDDILKLNPGLDPKELRAGDVIEVPGGEVNGPAKPPKEEKRRATQRRAAGGSKVADCPDRVMPVPKHLGYWQADSAAGWATAQTNQALKRGFDHLFSRHKLAPRVEVLDASLKDLGPVGDHRSHQDGRDVDIAYYQKRCPRRGCPSEHVSAKDLDVRRQWTLLRYWLTSGDAEMIFVDQDLARALYAYAKKRGTSKRQLEEWFQYPRKPDAKEGIIRHWQGHKNHVHVRFRAAEHVAGRCEKP